MEKRGAQARLGRRALTLLSGPRPPLDLGVRPRARPEQWRGACFIPGMEGTGSAGVPGAVDEHPAIPRDWDLTREERRASGELASEVQEHGGNRPNSPLLPAPTRAGGCL